MPDVSPAPATPTTAPPPPAATGTTPPAPVAAGLPQAVMRWSLRSRRLWLLVVTALLIAAVVQFAGAAVIPAGVATITILPMVWGLVAGGVVSGQRWRRFGMDLQSAAAALMSVAVLLLVARLAFTIGPNVGLLVSAGPALLLQEVGHLFGTIVLALPLAVLLRMGPATVGATFSIDREGSFAMVSERYGADSPQYRGVLSMYSFGTLFGAVAISVIASLATSFGIFDPLALAMGAGVGSGSMMAAAAASVVEAHPELGDQVLAVAATSNLITGLLGLYVGMFIALPLADRVYRLLTRRAPAADASRSTSPGPMAPVVALPLTTTITVLVGLGTVVSSIAAGGFSWTVLGGYLLMAALVATGVGVARMTRGKVAALIVVITVGALLTCSVSPVSSIVLDLVAGIDFLSVCTVVLTIAGLSIGKDLPMLRTIGWKIIPVGLVAIAASYLLSVVVAEFALGLWS
jgi:hypothetical protein